LEDAVALVGISSNPRVQDAIARMEDGVPDAGGQIVVSGAEAGAVPPVNADGAEGAGRGGRIEIDGLEARTGEVGAQVVQILIGIDANQAISDTAARTLGCQPKFGRGRGEGVCRYPGVIGDDQRAV